MSTADVHRTIDAIWRIESAKVVGGLARLVRDVGLAEDLAQDALTAALETWPQRGVPDNPGAWLVATARNRAIDLARRRRREEGHAERLARDMGMQLALAMGAEEPGGASAGEVEDDVLRLMFACCHPVLSTDARVALTLRILGGLRIEEIARAFLVKETTIQARIVRAKRALAAEHVAFEIPAADEIGPRLASVMEVVYLVFNEGYSATAGEDWLRPALCAEALRLGRVLAGLVPDEAEVHGLVALMEIQASRAAARTGPDGRPVLLLDQDRSRWDPLLVRRGLTALDRAQAGGPPYGPYTLQAAIAGCHARAATAQETDWVRIAALYEALARATPSPVVELNRAVAVGMAFGPAPALAIVDALVDQGLLGGYHLVDSVRGDLLERLGRHAEAAPAFAAAAEATGNAQERNLLRRRAEVARQAGEDASWRT